MSLTIKLLDTDASIEKELLQSLGAQINSKLLKNKNTILSDLKRLIPAWMNSQPEIRSLLDDGSTGSLEAHFGIPAGQAPSVVQEIIQAIVDSVKVEIIKAGSNKNFFGGILFAVQPTDFVNLLSLGAARVITEKGTSLEWLNWLLTAGDSIIVIGYDYFPGNGGRSGGGIMVGGGAWRVPPQYSGTASDNFVTRALSGREDDITAIFRRISL